MAAARAAKGGEGENAPGAPTSLPQAAQFVDELARFKVPATVRVRRGIARSHLAGMGRALGVGAGLSTLQRKRKRHSG